MTKAFFRATQAFICFNLLSQLLWVSHLNFPTELKLNWDQLQTLIISVGLIYTLSGIFIGIYLFKKRYKLAFSLLILESTYYIFILFYWYQLILFKINLDSYKNAYYGFLAISLLFGISLIFSISKKKKWIRRAGILVASICFGHIIFELIPSESENSKTELLHQILAYAGSIVSIFWLLNFQNEISSLPTENDSLLDSP